MSASTFLGPALLLACASGAAGQDGRELFLRHCATCHGESGRGDGPARVTPRPRDLTSGKFSFGTSPEAVERTVRGGIAPTMPAFGELLQGEELRAIVAYVRSLMPASIEAAPSESRVPFGASPKIVRGQLPPRPNSDAPLPRGLVIGLPNQFTLEFRTDDVRLLRILQGGTDGAFVDRTDWRGRGGTPLEVYGDTLDPTPDLDYGPIVASGDGTLDMSIELGDVRVDGDTVRLDGRVLDDGTPIARYREAIRAVGVADGQGVHRRIELSELGSPQVLRIGAAGMRAFNVQRAERSGMGTEQVWYAARQRGAVEVVGLRAPRGAVTTIRAGVVKLVVPAGDRPFTRVDVLRLRMPQFDVDRIGDYAEGFER